MSRFGLITTGKLKQMGDPRYSCLRKIPVGGTVFNDDFQKKPILISRNGNEAIYVHDSTYYMDLRLRTFRIKYDDEGYPTYQAISTKAVNNDIALINFNEIVWDPIQKIGCYMYSEYNGSYYDRYAYYLFEVDEVTGELTVHNEVVMSTTQSPEGKWNIKPTGEILHLYETYPSYLAHHYYLRAARINKATMQMEWGSATEIEADIADYGRGGIIKYDPAHDKFLVICGHHDPVHHPEGYTHNFRVVDVNGLTLTIGSPFYLPNHPTWNPPTSRVFPMRFEWDPIQDAWLFSNVISVYLAPGVFYRQYHMVMCMAKMSAFGLVFGDLHWDERVESSQYSGDLLFIYNPIGGNWFALGQENQYSSYGEFSYAISGTADGLNFTWNEEPTYCPDALSEYADEHIEGMWCPEVNALWVSYEGYNTYWTFFGALPNEFWTNFQGQTEWLKPKSMFGDY